MVTPSRVLLVTAAFLAMTAFATGCDTADEAIQRDRKEIAGTWRIIELEINGNKAKEEDAKKLTVVNQADGTWTLLSDGEKVSKGTSTIDPSKKPKTIDFTPTEGSSVGNTYPGIYELGERTRRMCFAPPDKPRPTEFSAPADSNHILIKFERVKEE